MTESMALGHYFEDFEVGMIGRSPARTITESDIQTFAGLSGDYNPLHTDAQFAAATEYGQRIAHGLLGLSIASGLTWRLGWIEGTAKAFLEVNWRFRRPILIGDTVHCEIEVEELRPAPRMGGGLVTFGIRVINQHGAVTQKGAWKLLVALRED